MNFPAQQESRHNLNLNNIDKARKSAIQQILATFLDRIESIFKIIENSQTTKYSHSGFINSNYVLPIVETTNNDQYEFANTTPEPLEEVMNVEVKRHTAIPPVVEIDSSELISLHPPETTNLDPRPLDEHDEVTKEHPILNDFTIKLWNDNLIPIYFNPSEFFKKDDQDTSPIFLTRRKISIFMSGGKSSASMRPEISMTSERHLIGTPEAPLALKVEQALENLAFNSDFLTPLISSVEPVVKILPPIIRHSSSTILPPRPADDSDLIISNDSPTEPKIKILKEETTPIDEAFRGVSLNAPTKPSPPPDFI